MKPLHNLYIRLKSLGINNLVHLIFYTSFGILLLSILLGKKTFPDYIQLGKTSEKYFSSSHLNSFEISFSYLISATTGQSSELRYENLFQTSNYNSGVRLEISRRKAGTSTWGLVYSDSKGDLKVIFLGAIPATERWHKLRIVYSDGEVQIFNNGISLAHRENIDMKAQFNKVVSGLGFNDRVFHGKIRRFEIIRTINTTPIQILFLISAFLIIVTNLPLNHRQLPEIIKRTALFNREQIGGHTLDLKDFRQELIVFGLVIFMVFVAESKLITGLPLNRLLYISAVVFFSIILIRVLKRQFYFIKLIAFSFYSTLLFCLISIIFIGAAYITGRSMNYSDSIRGITENEVLAIFQTNLTESLEFLNLIVGKFNISLALLISAGFVFLIFNFSLKKKLENKLSTIFVFLVFLVGIKLVSPVNNSFFSGIYAGYVRFANEAEKYATYVKNRKFENLDLSPNQAPPETHIVVLGESVNRLHMGAYGYFRDTTPWLSSKLNDPSFNFFENAYSPHSHTVPSLMKVLTEANQYNFMEQRKAISIIEIAQKTGYETYWLSEQVQFEMELPLKVVLETSSIVKFVPEGAGAIQKNFNQIVKSLDPNNKNLIFIHLQGSHANYKKRLELCTYKEFITKYEYSEYQLGVLSRDQKFIDDLLRPYDSSIECTDKLIEGLFKSANKVRNLASFTYIADHGEDVFGRRFHNADNFSYPMTRVPFVSFFSDKWVKRNQEKAKSLKTNLNKVITTDLFFNYMLSLLNITFPRAESFHDILSSKYQDKYTFLTMQSSPDEDSARTLTKGRQVIDDPYLIAKSNVKFISEKYGDKIAAVNQDIKSKLFESNSLGFQGIEFNFDSSSLNIGHHPQYSFDIKLDHYLLQSPIKNMTKLWFDIKGASAQNSQILLEKLSYIDETNPIKPRAIIESWEDWLWFFSKNGWKTSYYLHETNYPDCKSFQQNLEKCAENIARKVKELGAKSISFAASYYGFVKEHVEPLLPKSITYHTFALPSNPNIYEKTFKEKIESEPIMQDNRVKTILLESSKKYGTPL